MSEEEDRNLPNDDQPPADPLQPKKTKFTFYMQAEVELLKEIIVNRPFDVKHTKITETWASIALRCGGKYAGETARRHFNLMMNQFRKDEAESLKASGTEEEYDEKIRLLQDVTDLINDAVAKKKKKATSSKREMDSRETGEAIRDAAMNGIDPADNAKKSRKVNQKSQNDFNDRLLTLMEAKHQNESDLRKKDQELQERKLKLEEERFRLEADERKTLYAALLKKI